MDKGMPVGHMREIAEPLNVFPHGLSSFLDCREKLVHVYLGVIFIKFRKKSGFQVDPRVDGVFGKAPELIKGYPLKGTDEQSGHDNIIIYYVAGL